MLSRQAVEKRWPVRGKHRGFTEETSSTPSRQEPSTARKKRASPPALAGVEPDSRMFPISKSYLHREMDRGCKQTGVKRIRIHDLRHSHISLLIDMGFTALAIAERV